MRNAEKKYVSEVIGLFFSGKYPVDVEESVMAWLASEDKRELKDAALADAWDAIPSGSSASAKSSLESVKARLGIDRRPVRRISLAGRFMRVAAVVIPLIVVGGIFFMSGGETQRLVVTASNEMKSFVLPDGSAVYMNENSIVEYPAAPTDGKRRIRLTGEASFEVAHLNGRAFEVATEHLVVKVTGTVFNVKAYGGDRNTLVTLAEGSVDVALEHGNVVSLNPDSQLIFDNTSGVARIAEVDAKRVMSWAVGTMEFQGATLAEIFRTVEASGNVVFDIAERIERLPGTYTVKFSRYDSVEDILTVLEAISDGFQYKREGNKVYIY